MVENIKVSICCLVYNHEKYLRKCLDGFIMQKTNFKFEVLIHDDASTDGSADIIKEYENKYPDIIKPIYQTENQYSKGVKISWNYQYTRAKGKYIAMCEGDDFWTDENKLQLQYDALEKNSGCSFCAHFVHCVDESGQIIDQCYPGASYNSLIPQNQFVELLIKTYPFQTSSYFFKREVIDNHISNIPDFVLKSNVGDVPLMLLCAFYGDAYFIEKEMSCYRLGVKTGWSRQKENIEFRCKALKINADAIMEYNRFTDFKYDDLISEKYDLINFDVLFLQKRYDEIKKSGYYKVIKTFPLKQRIFYFLTINIPFFEKNYKKIKGVFNKNE